MEDQLPGDGFKWFGEGFDGFPKRLPDDCVEYIIHVINDKLDSVSALRSRLNEILKTANELKKQHLKAYIWQRDAFDLSIHPKIELSKPEVPSITTGRQSQPYLRGRTDFGDSVADEWLVVFLLREISIRFPDAWIRVYDTDGEFLLIEAANSLPKWLNPEIAENRVWLNDGHIKILPLEEDATSRNLDLRDVLSTISREPDRLLMEPTIEKEAFYRLREYPSAISSSLHHSLIMIPRSLASILHRNPACISPAVESFYLRDPVSLRPLSSKDLSTLYFAPEDFVTTSVKFTKVGFAQLRSQLFDPPPAWTGIIPRMKDEKVAIGMKLTCGFEMMVADPQNQDKRTVREIKLLLDDIESGEEKLPTDHDISTWPQTQDDEKWLDIDYNDFEKELSGSQDASKDGFGNQGAQENLRKMVSRFQDFLNDDDAGAEGVDGMDDEDDNSGSDDEEEQESRHEEQDGSEDKEFERAMKETQTMPKSHLESSGLLEEARKLALQDDEDASDVDEDEEMRKVMELMERELKGHGALNVNDGAKVENKINGKGKSKVREDPQVPSKPYFGPERPPHMQQALAKKNVRFEGQESDDEVGPGDGELSSDDEDYNDVDLDLAKNMLESFKGQAGMAGPAGNLMKALGVGMPRDEDDDD